MPKSFQQEAIDEVLKHLRALAGGDKRKVTFPRDPKKLLGHVGQMLKTIVPEISDEGARAQVQFKLTRIQTALQKWDDDLVRALATSPGFDEKAFGPLTGAGDIGRKSQAFLGGKAREQGLVEEVKKPRIAAARAAAKQAVPAARPERLAMKFGPEQVSRAARLDTPERRARKAALKKEHLGVKYPLGPRRAIVTPAPAPEAMAARGVASGVGGPRAAAGAAAGSPKAGLLKQLGQFIKKPGIAGGVGIPIAAMFALGKVAQMAGVDPETRAIQNAPVPTAGQMMVSARANDLRQQRVLQALMENPELMAALQSQAEREGRSESGLARGSVVVGGTSPGPFQNASGLMKLLGG
jgi:hypothetical protein